MGNKSIIVNDSRMENIKTYLKVLLSNLQIRSTKRRQQTEETKRAGIPRISMDYFFFSSQGQEAPSNPMIVAADEHTGEEYARMCGK